MSQEELNGYPQLNEIRPDPTVQALRAQLSPLKEAQQLFKQALDLTEKVLRSLEAVTPALEMHIHGLNSENEQLKVSAADTESTYAGIVDKLESQVKGLKNKYSDAEQKLNETYQSEIQQLKQVYLLLKEELDTASAELKKYREETREKEQKPAQQETSTKPNPFSDLNIFGL